MLINPVFKGFLKILLYRLKNVSFTFPNLSDLLNISYLINRIYPDISHLQKHTIKLFYRI